MMIAVMRSPNDRWSIAMEAAWRVPTIKTKVGANQLGSVRFGPCIDENS
jgi:hypothetical protein